MLLNLPTALQGLLTTLLLSAPHIPRTNDVSPVTFHLRHQHATTNNSRIIFADTPSVSTFGEEVAFTIPTKRTRIHKPSSQADFVAARQMSRLSGMSMPLDWWEDDVPGPDLSQRSTLLKFAKMTFNTYYADNSSEWYDMNEDDWDKSSPFGWQPGEDGMRGHIFVSSDNSTVVIAVKGTSAGWLVGSGGPTTAKDKLNDNLLFSCCCARVGPTWSTVCGCYEGGYRCDQQCVQDALVGQEDLFYPVGLNLYNNVSYMYPDANIWITGHSLGGSLSSLIGVTFGVPVVAFEAPSEKMAAARLHLPSPPSTQHVTHVYHTADPIPMGACNGVTSTCAIGGFAMETRCHLGQVIRFDTVQRLGWSVDARTHPIKVIIDRLLGPNSEWKPDEIEDEDRSNWGESLLSWWGWPGRRGSGEGGKGDHGDGDGGNKGTRDVPLAKPAVEVEGVDGVCTDCFNWEFGDFRNSTGRKHS